MSQAQETKMLVCNALDERDLLRKKIVQSIKGTHFIGCKRKKDAKFRDGTTVEEFSELARSRYQSIQDMIEYYHKLDTAITLSNAVTMIRTQSGREMTVAAAISLRKALRGSGDVTTNFEGMLIDKLNEQLSVATTTCSDFNRKADNELENYKSNLTSRDSGKQLNSEELSAVETLVANLYGEIIDPLNIKEKLDGLVESYDRLVKELDTAIKVSNAGTYIELK